MVNDSYTKVHQLCINLVHEINREDFKKTTQIYPGEVEIADDGRTLIVKETYYNNKVGFDVYNREHVIRYSFIRGWAND